MPGLPDAVTREAYSHEVSSAGFWPGGGGVVDEPAFYSYAYPAPAGFADAKVKPAQAYFHKQLGEFILPYEAVRNAADPEALLLDFLQSTYDGGGRILRNGIDPRLNALPAAAPPATGVNSMLNWLHDLPTLVGAILVCAVFVVPTLAGSYLLQPYVARMFRGEKDINTVLGFLLNAFALYFGVLLALLSIAVFENHNKAEDAVVRRGCRHHQAVSRLARLSASRCRSSSPRSWIAMSTR